MTNQEFFRKIFAGGNDYWLTRFFILRLLGFVYAVAFLVAAQQLVPLVGEHGLTPANHFFERVQAHFGSRPAAALQLPSLFWFGISDQGLSIFAWVGFGLSLIVLGGYANAILLAILWAMYMSIIHVGQIWYGYGWETQLLETGFLSIFLCPLLDGRPFPKFGPPQARHIAGVLLVSFQIVLIISGNLSFLNYVTIIPFLACFDDTFLRRVLPARLVRRAERAAQQSEPSRIHNTIAVALSILVIYLSAAPVLNLVSGRQLMNYSYDPLDLVNTYGAFGAVGRERPEIIFEGTEDALITGDTKWKEYEFKAKPGDPDRRPPFVAPFQPRIDWQIWFASMASPGEYPWTLHFVWKLLHNDQGTLSLLANNKFPDAPPHYIRARLYRNRLKKLGEKGWWKREPIGEWLPALSSDDAEFRRILSAMDWLD